MENVTLGGTGRYIDVISDSEWYRKIDRWRQ